MWQPHEHAGYRPVAVDVTGFWRPRLQGCATSHYHGPAGKALPGCVPVGIVARVGRVGTQRLGLPLAFVRADKADPSVGCARAGVGAVGRAGDGRHRRAGARRRVRGPPTPGGRGNTLRRASGEERHLLDALTLPTYPGRGRPRTRGALIRPLARTYRDHDLAATPPNHTRVLAGGWDGRPRRMVGRSGAAGRHPDQPDLPPRRHPRPALDRAAGPGHHASRLGPRPARPLPRPLASRNNSRSPPSRCSAPPAPSSPSTPDLPASPRSSPCWPARSSPTLAATQPPVPTGSWDRRPRPTPGRLRRVLAQRCFSNCLPAPGPHSPKKPPSPPTSRRASGANDAVLRPCQMLRAHLSHSLSPR